MALLGVSLAALTGSAAVVDAQRISSAERTVFRALNDRTVLPLVVVWPLMQVGNLLAIPVAAAIAAVRRRTALAMSIAVGGAASYLLAKLIKSWVPRGRPTQLLADVEVRGADAAGLGFVSGHAAVAALLATLLWARLDPRWRTAVVGLATFVCLARVYVGAHLPLDVVGGAALGVAVGVTGRLISERRRPC